MYKLKYKEVKKMLFEDCKLNYDIIVMNTGISILRLRDLFDESVRHNFEADINLFYRISIGLDIPFRHFVGDKLVKQMSLKEENGLLLLAVRPAISPDTPIFTFCGGEFRK